MFIRSRGKEREKATGRGEKRAALSSEKITRVPLRDEDGHVLLLRHRGGKKGRRGDARSPVQRGTDDRRCWPSARGTGVELANVREKTDEGLMSSKKKSVYTDF